MTPDEKAAYARQFPVHVGVDTAKRFHVLVAMGPDGRRSRPVTALVSRAGFEAAHAHLQALFPETAPGQMLVGLEWMCGYPPICLRSLATYTNTPGTKRTTHS